MNVKSTKNDTSHVISIQQRICPLIDKKRLGRRWVKSDSLIEIMCGRLQLVHSGNQPNDMCSPTNSLCLLFVCVCESERQRKRTGVRLAIAKRIIGTRAHHHTQLECCRITRLAEISTFFSVQPLFDVNFAQLNT